MHVEQDVEGGAGRVESVNVCNSCQATGPHDSLLIHVTTFS
jgi:hypothetical protein